MQAPLGEVTHCLEILPGVYQLQECVSIYGRQMSRKYERLRGEGIGVPQGSSSPGHAAWRAWTNVECLCSLDLTSLVYKMRYSTECAKVRDHDSFLPSLQQSQIISTYTYKCTNIDT